MVVCFIGDSLTQGIGDQLALGWVGRLAQASFAKNPAHARSLTLCNLGLRSDTSLRIAQRWRLETDLRRRPGEDMAFVFSFGAADHKFDLALQDSLNASRLLLLEAASLGSTLYIAPPPALEPGWSAHIRQLGRRYAACAPGLACRPSTSTRRFRPSPRTWRRSRRMASIPMPPATSAWPACCTALSRWRNCWGFSARPRLVSPGLSAAGK